MDPAHDVELAKAFLAQTEWDARKVGQLRELVLRNDFKQSPLDRKQYQLLREFWWSITRYLEARDAALRGFNGRDI